MSDLSRKISIQLLAQAEERFLLEHDWEREVEAAFPAVIREAESLWTYRGQFKPRRRSNWVRVDRSHAVHAQKVVLRQQMLKDKDDPSYNQDDRD